MPPEAQIPALWTDDLRFGRVLERGAYEAARLQPIPALLEELVVGLASELAVSPSVVRRWQHLSTKGSSAAVASNQEVVPVSELRAAQQRIRELERALGKKTMEVEILRVKEVTGLKMAPICGTLGISRACAYRDSVGRPERYARAQDRVVTAQIRTVIRTRSSYGARRVRALVNRSFETSL